MYADYFHISPGQGAAGDMSAFGTAQTKLRLEHKKKSAEGLRYMNIIGHVIKKMTAVIFVFHVKLRSPVSRQNSAAFCSFF